MNCLKNNRISVLNVMCCMCSKLKNKDTRLTFTIPFHIAGLFIYPLKTSENLWFSDVFRG